MEFLLFQDREDEEFHAPSGERGIDQHDDLGSNKGGSTRPYRLGRKVLEKLPSVWKHFRVEECSDLRSKLPWGFPWKREGGGRKVAGRHPQDFLLFARGLAPCPQMFVVQ
jgi:hypothetical protein